VTEKEDYQPGKDDNEEKKESKKMRVEVKEKQLIITGK